MSVYWRADAIGSVRVFDRGFLMLGVFGTPNPGGRCGRAGGEASGVNFLAFKLLILLDPGRPRFAREGRH